MKVTCLPFLMLTAFQLIQGAISRVSHNAPIGTSLRSLMFCPHINVAAKNNMGINIPTHSRLSFPLPVMMRGMKSHARKLAMAHENKADVSIPYIEVDDRLQYAWRLSRAAEILQEGGVGIVPTDTCYCFVTNVHSHLGIERVYSLSHETPRVRKPLTLLCHSLSQIADYTTAASDPRVYKMLKDLLPGPYTFILPATHNLPKMVFEHKKHHKHWKSHHVSVRIPDDAVLLEILRGLTHPLLATSVPLSDEESEQHAEFDPQNALKNWKSEVDFVVSNGIRPERFSTVVDLTEGEPVLLRHGSGSFSKVNEYYLPLDPVRGEASD